MSVKTERGASEERGDRKEPWVTFTRDPSAWGDVLRAHGADDVSRQTLFLLAQLSEEGFQEANHIIATLLKHAGYQGGKGKGGFEKVSAPICVACKNAMQRLQQGSSSSWQGWKGNQQLGCHNWGSW